MSNKSKVIIGITTGVVTLVLITTMYIWSAYSTAQKFESSMIAQDESMQNTFSNMNKTIKQMGFTVKNYAETDIKKMELAIKRYEGKPGLLMQWAQENGNTFSPVMHRDFMQAIERLNTRFENSQKTKIAHAQEYRTFLTASFKGKFFASGFFDFPTKKTEEIMNRIIKTQETTQTWSTGIEKVENPF